MRGGGARYLMEVAGPRRYNYMIICICMCIYIIVVLVSYYIMQYNIVHNII